MLSRIKNKKIYVLFSTCLLIILFFIPNAKLLASTYETITLKNGLKVHIIKTDDIIISHAIVYNVGMVDQPINKVGVANLVEQMMNFGTNRYSKERLQDLSREMSGKYHSFTFEEGSFYYFSIPEEYLEEVMKIEANRMNWLRIDETDLPEAIDNIIKFNLQFKSNIYDNFYSSLLTYLFPTTNYSETIIKDQSVLEKITTKDIRDFYEFWYVPNNAQVFIIGNVDVVRAKNLAQKHYGDIAISRDFKNDTKYIEEPYEGNVTFKFVNEEITKPLIIKSYLVPSLLSNNSINREEAYSLLVFQEILLDKSGKVYKDLVEIKEILSDFYVKYDDSKKGLSAFSFYLFPQENISEKMALAHLDRALEDLITEGFSIIDLRLSVTKIRDKIDLQKDDNIEYMFTTFKYLNGGLTFNELNRRAHIASTITSQDIVEVYNTYMKGSNYVLGIASAK